MIEGKKYQAAGVEFVVNPTDILETLQTVEKLTVDEFKKLAAHYELPVTPFEKRLIKPVVMGFVQEEWYKTHGGGVPEKCLANQAARVERYKQQLEEVKANGDGKDAVVGRKAKDGDAAPRTANLYRLTDAKKEEWSKFKGQKRLIVNVMVAQGAVGEGKGITVKTIADNVKETEETVAPSIKNCAFHINAWGHEGIVERVDENGEVAGVQMPKGQEKPAEEEKPVPKKQPSPAAPTPAKKKKK